MEPARTPSSPAGRRERRERLGRELRRRRSLRSTTVQVLYALGAFALGVAVPQIFSFTAAFAIGWLPLHRIRRPSVL